MKHTSIGKNKLLKNFFLTISIITGFIFIVAFSSMYVSDAIKNNNACGCVIPIPYMILILSSLGIFVGSLASYSLMSKYIKETKGKNIESTLDFLSPNEKKIIKELIKNKQGINQSEFEKITGLHRVKIHRTIQKLKEKGIINKINKGKINKIKLNEELTNLFQHN